MTTSTGTKKLTFKSRQKRGIHAVSIILICIFIQTNICQATIVNLGQYSWQDEPLLRRGIWFESLESNPYGPAGMWAFGPRINNNDFLWSLSNLVPEGSEPDTMQFGNWLELTSTEWNGGTLELAQEESLWGSEIICYDVTATVMELTNSITGRILWKGISLSGMSNDGISVDFMATLRTWINWPWWRIGRVKKINIAIAPEPSTLLIFGLLATLCLPYSKFVNKDS
jgi:hypothetical protein